MSALTFFFHQSRYHYIFQHTMAHWYCDTVFGCMLHLLENSRRLLLLSVLELKIDENPSTFVDTGIVYTTKITTLWQLTFAYCYYCSPCFDLRRIFIIRLYFSSCLWTSYIFSCAVPYYYRRLHITHFCTCRSQRHQVIGMASTDIFRRFFVSIAGTFPIPPGLQCVPIAISWRSTYRQRPWCLVSVCGLSPANSAVRRLYATINGFLDVWWRVFERSAFASFDFATCRHAICETARLVIVVMQLLLRLKAQVISIAVIRNWLNPTRFLFATSPTWSPAWMK